MKIYLLLPLLVALALSQKPKTSNNIATSKADELRELSLGSKDRIIQLNATGYFYYTMEFPRPYDVVIYLTAPNCKLCEELLSEFKLVAQFYYESNALQAYKDEKSSKRAVFFAVVTFTDLNRQVFNQLGFSSVPNLFVSQPKIVLVPQDERALYLRDFKWMITHTDGHVTAHKLLEYINRRTGRSIEYKPQFLEVLTMIGILLGVIALAIILFRGFKTVFNNPTVWFVGSIAIYIICMGGLVHNIIHNIPFTSVDAQGNVEWRATGGRQQLGAEGFVMSICISFVGITMILYHKLLKVPTLCSSPFVLKLCYVSLFVVTYVLTKFIEDVYKEKSWYDPRFWPPAHYIKGSIMKDQGNSI